MKPLMNEEFKEKLQNNMIQVMEKAKDLFYVEQYTHTYTFQGEERNKPDGRITSQRLHKHLRY